MTKCGCMQASIIWPQVPLPKKRKDYRIIHLDATIRRPCSALRNTLVIPNPRLELPFIVEPGTNLPAIELVALIEAIDSLSYASQ
jgi:hypothetical protein